MDMRPSLLVVSILLCAACTSSTERDDGPPSLGDFVVAPDTLAVDRVSPIDDGVTPDGHQDGVFETDVVGPIVQLAVISTDETGGSYGNQQWDTIIGDAALPSEMLGTYYMLGRETWVLGIEEDGTSLNRPDGSMEPLGLGAHHLRLYVSNEAAIPITAGFHFQLVAWLEDGTMLRGPVIEH